MPAISHRHAVYSMIQYLERNHLEETARTLERESGFFFNMAYFEECFIHGAFDEALDYVNGFTTVHDNVHSTNVIYEIRWHKFLEALDENNLDRARTILEEELRTFEQYNGIMSQAVELLNLGNNFRLHHMYRRYGDPVVARASTMPALRRSLERNPNLFGKIYQYPIERANAGPGGGDVVVALPAQLAPPPHPPASARAPAPHSPSEIVTGGETWMFVPCPHGGVVFRRNNNNNNNNNNNDEEDDSATDPEEENNQDDNSNN